MNKVTKIVLGVAVVVVALVGAGVAYFLSGDAEEKPTVDNVAVESDEGKAAAATDVDTLDGTWTLTPDSVVQYRVEELLRSIATTATGKTSDVTGSLTVEGTSVTAASFEVQVATFESDESMRDGQFRGRIMETERFPTATFELTAPIELGEIPADGATTTATATGELTLKDTTKEVELQLNLQREGALFKVDGSYTVVFADWNIENPSIGIVDTEDQGDIEVALFFAKD